MVKIHIIVEEKMTDEGREAEAREAGGESERELDHHVIGMVGEGTWEDEVAGDMVEDSQ